MIAHAMFRPITAVVAAASPTTPVKETTAS